MADQFKKMLPCPKIVREQPEFTTEQHAYARQFAQECITSMLSIEAVDEAEAEAHLSQVYHIAGLKPPQMRWFDSPMAFLLAYAPPKMWESLSASVQGSLKSSVWKSQKAKLGTSVDDTVWESMEGSLGESRQDWVRNLSHVWSTSVWPNTWEGLGESMEDSVGGSLRTKVQESVSASLEDRVEDAVGDSIGASVLAYYRERLLAFYHFLHEVCEPNHFLHLARFNELVSGYYLGQKKAWLVRKPTLLRRDEQGRFHSAEEMCLQYRDGWGFYAWHGVRVPMKLILHPEQLTKEDWLQERNLEVRRSMQERLGHDRFMEVVEGICIDQGMRGELIEVELGTDPEQLVHYVHVKGTSTERPYYVRVPLSIRRADEAVAWTFDLDEQDQPMPRTWATGL